MTKSVVFAQYNQLRRLARLAPQMIDMDRLNRALGIALSQAEQAEDEQAYHPTTCDCGCKDWEFRFAQRRKYAGPCKHQLAQLILTPMG